MSSLHHRGCRPVLFIVPLQIDHLSSGYPLVTGIGVNMHISSHMSFVMCYPAMNV